MAKSGAGNKSTKKNNKLADSSSAWRQLALRLLMERTWQLIASIFIPIIVGIWLDSFFHTFPGLFIAGIVAAALAVTILAIKNVKSAG